MKRVALATLAGLLVLPASPVAQSTSTLAGTWTDTSAARPGGLPRRLVIDVTAAGVTIQRDGAKPELYPFRREVQRPDGGTAMAVMTNGVLTVTLSRAEGRSDGMYQIVAEETYRVSDDLLVLERRASVQRPSGRSGPSQIVTATYRR